ncbi:Glyoxalase/Bleomycin resistance protein/Dihydroxybiphenyl dioxygenase [Coccomyxa subellipsoidea C-169]|uniref:Glyoxalase/Bleomycin resistance protein/Dihydroxybiphenyl dioxygenase n=1 Tax=Coccomyxa subellipsoidea (strain C-169) TaxID=574566 RepID=I0YPJ9_COCSC|nr:Glyoxalase/Bleomycin resistance protein/Dihydroxybiphenyl dioxygenase [Coccomyxa subellipsoidea C-169]EIE20318.1 Glyoxalase/Bleomycin resistance protein/Dihydroxybiphenyl dioxygenase [Coccomyxa subellipsoidea C-169]|eukprot:XP_005644862.1 Glyoxalase/Bleomycin resistance protein/Dihydroxybiphenyl dioxygenase [Coccomyxa subellipsoidea C-169]
MIAVLRHVLLLQKDVRKAANFYQQGLGLPVNVLTEKWAELQAGNSKIALKAVDGEAFTTCGYTPFLAFEVADLQESVQRLLQLGATLDGPIKYPARGKVAVLRGPDGHMLSLFEPEDSA